MPLVGAGRRLRSSMAPGECESIAAIVPCACVVMCVGVRDRAKSPWIVLSHRCRVLSACLGVFGGSRRWWGRVGADSCGPCNEMRLLNMLSLHLSSYCYRITM